MTTHIIAMDKPIPKVYLQNRQVSNLSNLEIRYLDSLRHERQRHLLISILVRPVFDIDRKESSNK